MDNPPLLPDEIINLILQMRRDHAIYTSLSRAIPLLEGAPGHVFTPEETDRYTEFFNSALRDFLFHPDVNSLEPDFDRQFSRDPFDRPSYYKWVICIIDYLCVCVDPDWQADYITEIYFRSISLVCYIFLCSYKIPSVEYHVLDEMHHNIIREAIYQYIKNIFSDDNLFNLISYSEQTISVDGALNVVSRFFAGYDASVFEREMGWYGRD